MLLSAKKRACSWKSIAIEMGGVSRCFSKASGSGVNVTPEAGRSPICNLEGADFTFLGTGIVLGVLYGEGVIPKQGGTLGSRDKFFYGHLGFSDFFSSKTLWPCENQNTEKIGKICENHPISYIFRNLSVFRFWRGTWGVFRGLSFRAQRGFVFGMGSVWSQFWMIFGGPFSLPAPLVYCWLLVPEDSASH